MRSALRSGWATALRRAKGGRHRGRDPASGGLRVRAPSATPWSSTGATPCWSGSFTGSRSARPSPPVVNKDQGPRGAVADRRPRGPRAEDDAHRLRELARRLFQGGVAGLRGPPRLRAAGPLRWRGGVRLDGRERDRREVRDKPAGRRRACHVAARRGGCARFSASWRSARRSSASAWRRARSAGRPPRRTLSEPDLDLRHKAGPADRPGPCRVRAAGRRGRRRPRGAPRGRARWSMPAVVLHPHRALFRAQAVRSLMTTCTRWPFTTTVQVGRAARRWSAMAVTRAAGAIGMFRECAAGRPPPSSGNRTHFPSPQDAA